MATKSEPSKADPVAAVAPPVAAAVALKLPPYWPNDPVIWFAQVEAQFLTRNIQAEITKYSYVVGSLQPTIAQEVRDLLINPPVTHPYTKLKEELIKRTSESEQKRLQKLLTTEELGDKKPSQLLRKMEQLLGNRTLEPSILKQLFMQRLPTNVQLILASTSDVDITQLAKLADKIVEVSPPAQAIQACAMAPAPTPPLLAAVKPPVTSDIQRLQAQVEKLTAQMEMMVRQNHYRHSRSHSRDSSQYRHRGDRSPSTSGDNNSDFCWYHWKYGDKARNCKEGCTYTRKHSTPPAQGNSKAGE